MEPTWLLLSALATVNPLRLFVIVLLNNRVECYGLRRVLLFHLIKGLVRIFEILGARHEPL